MQVVKYKDRVYPHFQSIGNASQFAIPYAKHFCKGDGYDIGCMKPEWAFPNATPIDLDFDDPWHADNLPEGQVDYIFSSHCLEHVSDWVETLLYWTEKIKSGGTLFLYLPHYDQEYWRPWNNKKHIHIFTPHIFEEYCKSNNNISNFLISGIDLNNSFYVVLNIK